VPHSKCFGSCKSDSTHSWLARLQLFGLLVLPVPPEVVSPYPFIHLFSSWSNRVSPASPPFRPFGFLLLPAPSTNTHAQRPSPLPHYPLNCASISKLDVQVLPGDETLPKTNIDAFAHPTSGSTKAPAYTRPLGISTSSCIDKEETCPLLHILQYHKSFKGPPSSKVEPATTSTVDDLPSSLGIGTLNQTPYLRYQVCPSTIQQTWDAIPRHPPSPRR
jgi:hypothetical protein